MSDRANRESNATTAVRIAATRRRVQLVDAPPAATGRRHGVAGLLELQRTLGNAQVERLIHRYAVPSGLPCGALVEWLDAHSPYAPEWAQTASTFVFNGRASISVDAETDGTFTAHIKGHRGLTVGVTSPVDRPFWNPTPRPGRRAEVQAWQAMRASLDAHERQHGSIAEQERGRLDTEWKATDITASGATRSEARAAAAAALQAQQQEWKRQGQAAQDAIDPFRGAVLACPDAGVAP